MYINRILDQITWGRWIQGIVFFPRVLKLCDSKIARYSVVSERPGSGHAGLGEPQQRTSRSTNNKSTNRSPTCDCSREIAIAIAGRMSHTSRGNSVYFKNHLFLVLYWAHFHNSYFDEGLTLETKYSYCLPFILSTQLVPQRVFHHAHAVNLRRWCLSEVKINIENLECF